MFIDRIRLSAYRVPFVRPFTTAMGTVTHREGVIAELFCGADVGLGEGALLPGERGSDAVLSAAERLGRSLLGVEMAAAAARLGTASGLCDIDLAGRSALDIAIADLTARTRGVPLSMMMSSIARPEVAVNAVIGATTVAEAVSQANDAVAQGHGTLKLKVGLAGSPAGERALVMAVRTAVGPEIRLRIDANGAWDSRAATATLLVLEDLNVEFVEQPLPPGDLRAMRRVCDSTIIAVAADEAVIDLASARAIIRSEAADLLVLKPLKLGGVGPTLEIMRLAGAAGLECVVTTSLDTGVGTAAALHLAATLPAGSPAAGLATAALIESTLTVPDLPIVGGRMSVPWAPGLGVELDRAALDRYTTRTIELR